MACPFINVCGLAERHHHPVRWTQRCRCPYVCGLLAPSPVQMCRSSCRCNRSIRLIEAPSKQHPPCKPNKKSSGSCGSSAVSTFYLIQIERARSMTVSQVYGILNLLPVIHQRTPPKMLRAAQFLSRFVHIPIIL